MLSSKVKDLKLRIAFKKLENFRLVNKFLFINLVSKPMLLSSRFNKTILKTYLMSRISKIKIKNRCILSNRNGGVNKFYNLSRISMRNMIKFGLLGGYKKAVW